MEDVQRKGKSHLQKSPPLTNGWKQFRLAVTLQGSLAGMQRPGVRGQGIHEGKQLDPFTPAVQTPAPKESTHVGDLV